MYFDKCQNLDELKKEYRLLAMRNHPDRGGDLETMKRINAEHDARFEVLKVEHNATADEYHQTTESPEEFRDIIASLLNLDGLIVELCGSWLWISGKTKDHKDALKAIGCQWSQNKTMWYWHHAEEGRKWHKTNSTISDIRRKYGSQVYRSNGDLDGIPA